MRPLMDGLTGTGVFIGHNLRLSDLDNNLTAA